MSQTNIEPAETSPTQIGRRWYVAQTLAKRELFARAQLQAQAFRVFCPYVMRTVRHARKTRTTKVAFFPGYLFLALDLERERWRSVNGTLGVMRLVSSADGAPLPAPRGVVEAMQGYVDESGACRFDRDLGPGQSVRVITGPFAETIGTLIRLEAKDRAQVLIEILGGRSLATLARSALEAA